MAWKIELSEAAKKNLEKMDKPVAKHILRFLEERIVPAEDPRLLGEALRGAKLGEFWKYRVGDWRIVCSVLDERVIVYVLRVGHRRDVYRDSD